MNDQFDRNIRSKIYLAETDVPDSAWQAIELQLRPRKNRRWLFLILLPAVLAFYWSLSQPGPEDHIALSDVSDTGKSIVPEIYFNPSKPILEHSTIDSEHALPSTHKVANTINPRPKVTKTANPLVEVDQITTSKNSSSINQSHLRGLAPGAAASSPSIENIFSEYRDSKIEDPTDGAFEKLNFVRIPGLDFSPQTNLRDPKIDVCPSFRTSLQIRPFFELLISGGLPSKYYALKETELTNYQTLRERTEKERTSFSLQALVGADIGDRFEVKTGLGATRIFEIFDYIDESATRTIKNIIIDTIFVNGVPEIRKDSSIVIQYGQRIKLSQNRYTALELPVMATYKFKVQNHQFFIQGGVIMNLALWTKGDILTPDEHITSIDTKESRSLPIFRSRTGLDVTASLGYELELSESNKLRVLCSFRQTLGDFTASEYPLSQRYNHYHLGASWKHQF
ncbi:MAG: hypothetical protein IPL46_27285 [Saprospiraceae bacterium]|nr:hypothetical protein [Saprospiraceae bacterium]